MLRIKPSFALGLLLLVTFVLYAPSLGNDFVTFDDNLLIYQNQNVIDFSGSIFTSYDPQLYIPITLLSYQIEHFFFGLNPFIFHLTSLLLHLISVILIYRITRMLASRRLDGDVSTAVGLFCCAIFALHPLNTEAIAWAGARKDILSSTLFFGSLLFYLRYLSAEERRPYIWSIVLFALSLGAKVSVVMLPLVMLLIDYYWRRPWKRQLLTEKIPFFSLSLVFGTIALFGKKEEFAFLDLSEKVLLSLKGAFFYCTKTFFPTQLSLFHPQETPIVLGAWEFLVPIIVFAAIGTLALLHTQKRTVLLGLGLFLMMLVPGFASFSKNGYIYFASERFGYAAIVGILFMVGMMLVPLFIKKNRMRSLGIGLLSIVLLALASQSFLQSRTWADSEALYRHTLQWNPRSTHALNNLGSVLYEQGKLDEALLQYEQALAIDPYLPQVHVNRGLLLRKQGNDSGAMAAFIEGTQKLPTDRPLIEEDLNAFFFLAEAQAEKGDLSASLKTFEDAVKNGPQFANTHHNLGLKYQQYRQLENALTEFRAATTIDSHHIDAHYRLAATAAELGFLDEAVTALERVVWLQADYEEAAEHLENIRNLLHQNET